MFDACFFGVHLQQQYMLCCSMYLFLGQSDIIFLCKENLDVLFCHLVSSKLMDYQENVVFI